MGRRRKSGKAFSAAIYCAYWFGGTMRKVEQRAYQCAFPDLGAALGPTLEGVFGEEIAGVLRAIPYERMWIEQPGKTGMIIDCREDSQPVQSPTYGYEYIRDRFPDGLQEAPIQMHHFGSIVLVYGKPPSDQTLLTALPTAYSALKPMEAVLFIMEPAGYSVDPDTQLDMLADTRFVERSDKKIGDYLLLCARKPKSHEHHEVDLFRSAARSKDPWKQRYLQYMFDAMIRQYEENGIQVLDTREIESILHASKNPPDDLSKLRNGFGVYVRLPCGCEHHVTTKGVFEQSRRCGERHDALESIALLTQGHIYDTNHWVLLQDVCFSCGKPMEERTQLLGYHGDKATIQVEHCCVSPGCIDNGLLDTSVKTVPKKNIR